MHSEHRTGTFTYCLHELPRPIFVDFTYCYDCNLPLIIENPRFINGDAGPCLCQLDREQKYRIFLKELKLIKVRPWSMYIWICRDCSRIKQAQFLVYKSDIEKIPKVGGRGLRGKADRASEEGLEYAEAEPEVPLDMNPVELDPKVYCVDMSNLPDPHKEFERLGDEIDPNDLPVKDFISENKPTFERFDDLDELIEDAEGVDDGSSE